MGISQHAAPLSVIFSIALCTLLYIVSPISHVKVFAWILCGKNVCSNTGRFTASAPAHWQAAPLAPLALLPLWANFSAEQVSASASSPLIAHIPSWVFSRVSAGAEPLATAGPPSCDSEDEAAALLGSLVKLSRSQHGEDLLAYETFFKCKRGGLILETGGYTGMHLSTSSMFEFGLGWRSVHFEASPTSYSQLVVNRPNALNIHAAICSEIKTVHYVWLNSSVSSVSGIWEFMTKEFLKGWWPELAGTPKNMKPISCRPLSPLLALFNLVHVDLWILDIEGAELVALQGFDFGAISVDVIVIEGSYEANPKEVAIAGLLKAARYNFSGTMLGSTWWVSSTASKRINVNKPIVHKTRGPCTDQNKAKNGICD